MSGSRLDEMILEEIENNMSFSEDWQKYYSKERIKEGIRKKNSKLLPTTRKRRFLNLILDYIGIFIFSLALGFILGITGLFITLEIEHMNEWLLGIIITILYYIIFESIWSKTPAKFITKTKIITEDGEKPDYKTIFIRTLIRFVPFEIFSFLGTERPRGWHDEWSKTIVVNDMPIKSN